MKGETTRDRGEANLPEKIIRALYQRDYKELERFLNADTIDLREEDFGRTLLMLAVTATDGDVRMVRFLIERGADVNLADRSGKHTALHFAASLVRKDMAQALLKAGADPNAQNDSGWTPLHNVVRAPDLRAFLIGDLVKYGGDPDLKDASGSSPKEESERWGRSDLFRGVQPPKRKPRDAAKSSSSSRARGPAKSE